jgi:hypothetical protein
MGDFEVPDVFGHEYGHIGEQFVSFLDRSDTRGGLTTNLKIALLIEKVAEFLSERWIVTN